MKFIARMFGIFALCATATEMSLSASPALAQEMTMKSGACETGPSSQFICGPTNAEELVRIKGTPWVLTSQIHGEPLGITEGTIFLVHKDDRSWGTYSVAGHEKNFERTKFPHCPSILTGSAFSGHGMAIGPVTEQSAFLYAINHGAREAIEVFRIELSGAAPPSLTWVGCIPSPGDDFLNTLAVLPDGGIAATKFFELENRETWFGDAMSGKPTGAVYEWHEGQHWTMVPGTRLAGPNGIVLTDDGHYIVAEWGTKRVHKFPRAGYRNATVVELKTNPDNIHATDDGRYLVVGQDPGYLRALNTCLGTSMPVCPGSFSVIEIEPKTMSLRTIRSETGTEEFGFGTSALIVDGHLWIGTIRGRKIATYPLE